MTNCFMKHVAFPACFMENHISLVPPLHNITSTQISIFIGIFIIQNSV